VAIPKPGQPVVLSPAARQDIRDLLLWSLDRFGADSAERYRKLLIQALRDLEADPMRTGSRTYPELHKDARIYFLASSRTSVGGQRVKAPRHFILYRIRPGGLEVGRILHDSRDLSRHLPAEYRA
jgi:toxin ParE1/3/4